MVNNILLYPNCDLHMTLDPAPGLALRVVRQQSSSDLTRPYQLTTLPLAQDPQSPDGCVFDWFRPYDTPGTRLNDKPTLVPGDGVKTTAVVTQATPGIYLFQLRVGPQYLVGRLQVHQRAVSWWFGNDEALTTLRDPIAHAQPSIYAKFSEDDTGVDLVGDITGHGYVKLTESDRTVFTVSADDRLLGLKEASDPDPTKLPTVTGAWPGLNDTDSPNHHLPVRVVDLSTVKHAVDVVRPTTLENFTAKENIVFLAEGFTRNDEERFNSVVQQVAEEIFTKPRHEPYPTLKDNFNVFKVFTPSAQQTVTCGFSVKDVKSPGVKLGTPLPIEFTVSGSNSPYNMMQLIGLVGLPRRNKEPVEPDDVRVSGSRRV